MKTWSSMSSPRSLGPSDQHHSEASFVSHHAAISFYSIWKRNGFDHRTDPLQGAEGKRVLRVYRRSSHGSRNRTHTEKKRDRIDANRFVSSRSSDNKLAAWSKSPKEWRHGFTVCRCSEDQPGTAQILKRGHGILSAAVNVMMSSELFGEAFLFRSAGNLFDLKPHASRKLNSKVTEPADSLDGDEFAGPGLRVSQPIERCQSSAKEWRRFR